jgi:hypothetical protein
MIAADAAREGAATPAPAPASDQAPHLSDIVASEPARTEPPPIPGADIRQRLRAARMAPPRADESEVSIVPVKDAVPAPAAEAAPGRSLRTRLRVAGPPAETIDAASHAAYRGSVEEASVEIVRRPAGETAGEVAAPVEPRLISRFLRALKGRKDPKDPER